jgi:hypothetical protein
MPRVESLLHPLDDRITPEKDLDGLKGPHYRELPTAVVPAPKELEDSAEISARGREGPPNLGDREELPKTRLPLALNPY